MSEYFILLKVKCPECDGTGLWKTKAFKQMRGGFNIEVVDRESDCLWCEGKGYKLDPVELDREVFDDLKFQLTGSL